MLVPGEEGLRDIRIVEAIYKSARSGQRISLEFVVCSSLGVKSKSNHNRLNAAKTY